MIQHKEFLSNLVIKSTNKSSNIYLIQYKYKTIKLIIYSEDSIKGNGVERRMVGYEPTCIKKDERTFLHFRQSKPCDMFFMRYRSLNHILFKASNLLAPITLFLLLEHKW